MAVANISAAELRAELEKRLKDGSITKDQATKAVMEFKMAQTPQGGLVEAVWEPIKAIAGGMVGQIGSGYAGLFKLATGQGVDAAAETVRDVQEDVAEAVAPETVIGRDSLQTVSDIVQLGVDAARVPISGLGGIVELLSGQSLDQAAKTVDDINTNGVSQTAGDRVLEETGSPLFATVASMTPELVATAIPVIGKMKKASRYNKHIANKIRDGQSDPAIAQKIQHLSQKIKEGKLDVESLAEFDDIGTNASRAVQARLVSIGDDIAAGVDPKSIAGQLDDLATQAATPTGTKDLALYIRQGAEGLKTDKLAKEAVKQGFDEGVIASVKASTGIDRAKMLRMVDSMEKGKADALYATTNRPTDIVGASLLERVKFTKKVNQDAGAELNKVAKGLKGKPVDSSMAVNSFISRLDDMGVRLDKELKPIFQGSDIEGATAAENLISKVVARMHHTKAPDAYDMHRMKKFIDEQITYGKTGEGLSGKTEGVIKKLRRDIDRTLDEAFPEYDKVNTRFSDTINALDSLQDVAGKKVDLFGPNGDKAVGTLLRRMMSNAQSRINLSDAVDDLERISIKYGAEFDDNIRVQMLFADELDSVLGPVARTGFQRSVGEGVKYGVEAATGQKTGIGILADAAGKLSDKARGISDANAVTSIRKILERKQ